MAHDGVRTYLWTRVPPAVGHAMARIEQQETGWRVSGAEVSRGDPGGTMSCTFDIRLDESWHTLDVRAHSYSEEARRLQLTQEGGRWSQGGAPRPDLQGCLDVDVSATPVTNTFPLRRLDALAVGEYATVPVAWVDVPSLEVRRVLQTYRRVALPEGPDPAVWEYSDPEYGAFRLSVDEDGVVIDYENFAVRTATP